MKKAVILLALCFSGFLGFGQIVTMDSVTHIISGEIPFDQPFYLHVKHEPGKKPTSLIIQKTRNGKYRRFTGRDARLSGLVYGDTNTSRGASEDKNNVRTVINLQSSNTVKKVKDGSLIEVFPLAPATDYQFQITFRDVSYSKAKRDALVKASQEAEKLVIPKNALEPDALSLILKKDPIRYSELIHYKSNKLDSNLLQKKVDSVQNLEKKIEDIDLTSSLNCYKRRLVNINRCDTCSMYDVQFDKAIMSTNGFITMEQAHLTNINEGFISITDSKLVKPAGKYDYPKRVSNLKKTYQFLENYLAIEQLSDSPTCIDSNVLIQITKKITDLTKLTSKWSGLIKKYANTVSLYDPNVYKVSSVVGFTQGGLTMDSKGKFSVRPDFGVSVASFNGFTRVMPAVGVRFNFRPLNHNLAYGRIPLKRLAHRSSVGITFTTNSISDESTRFNLFGSSNLIVDYGFRLNNAMSVSLGGLVFKRADPNPFITNQQLALMPTLGLSVDFEILETLKDVKNLLTGK